MNKKQITLLLAGAMLSSSSVTFAVDEIDFDALDAGIVSSKSDTADTSAGGEGGVNYVSDLRLNDLATLLSDLKDKKITDKLIITGDDLFVMRGDVAAELLSYPNVYVMQHDGGLVGTVMGELTERIQVPFDKLLFKLKQAAIANDTKAIKSIKSSFVPAHITLDTLAKYSGTEIITEQEAKVMSLITTKVIKTSGTKNRESGNVLDGFYVYLLLDVYNELGGLGYKAAENEQMMLVTPTYQDSIKGRGHWGSIILVTPDYHTYLSVNRGYKSYKGYYALSDKQRRAAFNKIGLPVTDILSGGNARGLSNFVQATDLVAQGLGIDSQQAFTALTTGIDDKNKYY